MIVGDASPAVGVQRRDVTSRLEAVRQGSQPFIVHHGTSAKYHTVGLAALDAMTCYLLVTRQHHGYASDNHNKGKVLLTC